MARSAAGRQAIGGGGFIDSGGSSPLAVDDSREHSPGSPAARHAAKPGFPPRKPGLRAIGCPWSRGPLRNVEHWQSGLVGSLETSRFDRRKGSSTANTRFSSVVANLGLPTLHFPQHPSYRAPQNRSRAAKSRRPRGRVAAKSRCERSLAGGEPAWVGLTWHSPRWEDSSEAMASRPVAATSRCEHSHREAAAIRRRLGGLMAGDSRYEHSLREFAAMVQGLIGFRLRLRPGVRPPASGSPICVLTSGVSCQLACLKGARPEPRAIPRQTSAQGGGRGLPNA